MTLANLCIMERDGKVLMKLATRGPIKGKWNFPGGKVDSGETSEQSTIREVREETGYTVHGLGLAGKLSFFDGDEAFFSVDVYVAEGFSGTQVEGEEGKLRWFDKESVPLDGMSSADRFWVPMVLGGKRVIGEFHFEDKDVDRLYSHDVRECGAEELRS